MMTQHDLGPSTNRSTPKQLARLAGLFYIVLVIAGGLAHVVIRGRVYVAGDAAETARLVAENARLVRAGVLIDLVGALAFLLVGLTLYQLLRSVGPFAARLMATLVAMAVAITCLNLVFQLGGVLLATDEVYAGRETDTSILFMFDMQFYGYVLVQAFTGPWLFPFGYLVIRSDLFPKVLGGALIVGGFSYLADMAVHVLDPELGQSISELVLAPAILAEVATISYLLARGVRA